MVEIIGYFAAAFGTSLMIPQIIKTLKTKRASDLSLVMLIIYAVNCILWLIYGIFILANPIIVCNAIALFIGIFQLVLKIKYRSA